MALQLDDLTGRFAGDPDLVRKFAVAATDFAVNLCIAAVVLTLTFWLARWASQLVRRALQRFSRTRSDSTLQGFGASLARYAVIIVGLIAVLTRLGVETTSVIAVLGAASLAVGLALQGTLGNVAAGVMLLVFRPYKVGDFVEIAGKRGTVQSLDLFTTELATPENVKVVAPNGKVFGEFIMNFSAHPTRRLDMVFHVDFTVDLDDAVARLRTIASENACVLGDPAPLVEVVGLMDNWADVALRVWVGSEHCVADQAVVRSDLIVAVKRGFEAAGYPNPYPHQVAISRAGAGAA
jgi:small conductance mechanosensitive channel